MNETDQRRADVLTRLVGKSITTARAAQLLGITTRQVRRLRSAFEREGLAAIPHGNKGRRPAHATPPETAELIRSLAGPEGIYHDFNVCHLKDQLAREHQIVIGRSTLQRILQQCPKPPPVKRTPPARSRRLRCVACGMMVQIDGSLHDWLEGRGPKMCLIGAIDDATNTVLCLRFFRTETACGYLHLFRHIGITYGLPMSYYHDKHTILRSPKKATPEEELAGREPMSHIQRLLHTLGVESIAAHSPQAKGRIERLWQTLQDRLIKEMRLAGITTMEEANAFLESFISRFNARFAFEPMDLNDAWVPLLEGSDLDYLFSTEELRTVKADHTISYGGTTLQISSASRTQSLAGKVISVRTNAEGAVLLYHGRKPLIYTAVCKEQVPVVSSLSKDTPEKPTPTTQRPRASLTAKQRGYLYAKL